MKTLGDGDWLSTLVSGCAQFAPAVGSYAMATKLAGFLYDQEARGAGGARTCIGGRCYRCGPAFQIGYITRDAEGLLTFWTRWTQGGTSSEMGCSACGEVGLLPYPHISRAVCAGNFLVADVAGLISA